MNQSKPIVVEHYPVERLPTELRAGSENGDRVRVTVEREGTGPADTARDRPPLHTLIGTAKGAYSTPVDAVAAIRALRDEWE